MIEDELKRLSKDIEDVGDCYIKEFFKRDEEHATLLGHLKYIKTQLDNLVDYHSKSRIESNNIKLADDKVLGLTVWGRYVPLSVISVGKAIVAVLTVIATHIIRSMFWHK